MKANKYFGWNRWPDDADVHEVPVSWDNFPLKRYIAHFVDNRVVYTDVWYEKISSPADPDKVFIAAYDFIHKIVYVLAFKDAPG